MVQSVAYEPTTCNATGGTITAKKNVPGLSELCATLFVGRFFENYLRDCSNRLYLNMGLLLKGSISWLIWLYQLWCLKNYLLKIVCIELFFSIWNQNWIWLFKSLSQIFDILCEFSHIIVFYIWLEFFFFDSGGIWNLNLNINTLIQLFEIEIVRKKCPFKILK